MDNKTFKLVNPLILGKFDSTVTANNKNEAAQKIWGNVSQFITGNVPEFKFSFIGGDNKLYNYEVKENVTGKFADYEINELNIKINPTAITNFRNEIQRISGAKSLEGGKRRRRYDDLDDDDSDSDSVYDKLKLFKSINQQKPIVYLWYTPLLYSVPRFYVPTFSAPLTPYVEISLSSAFMG
jgi:hypothetical protein